MTPDELPYRVRKQIGGPFNMLIDRQNYDSLPSVGPVNTIKVNPYENLSVCTINRDLKYYKKYNKNKSSNNNKKYNTKYNKYDNKKFEKQNQFYGSTLAPDSIKYEQQMIEDNLDKPIEFVQGNICKLSPWSLWSKCPPGCPSYKKKKRTRIVLNEPKGCYSPTNPILEQVIPCNSTQCFCNSDC